MTAPPHAARVDWVDYAKGFCIVFVVMMHSTLGVEAALGQEGWMHYVVAFAKPFRMPDFFLISGLFLARVIDRDWRTYLDRKVVHFAYFYVLWVTIQFAFKAPGFAAEFGWHGVAALYLEAFIEPFGTLWFIYLLPIFFVVAKLARRVPPLAIWVIAAALEIAHIQTGWTVIDEFAARFVYFYTGYVLATRIFALAAAVQARPARALAGLGAWGILDAVLVFNGYADLPFVSLALGLAGAAGGGFGLGTDGDERPVPPVALLRPQLDRHLPRVLPADGDQPHGADQERPDRRRRHGLPAGHRGRRRRRAHDVLGRARHAAEIPVRTAEDVPAQRNAAPGAAAGGVVPPSS